MRVDFSDDGGELGCSSVHRLLQSVCVCRVCVRAASLHNEGHAKYAEEASKMWAEAKTDAYLELDIKGVKSELTRYMY